MGRLLSCIFVRMTVMEIEPSMTDVEPYDRFLSGSNLTNDLLVGEVKTCLVVCGVGTGAG